MPDTTPKKRGRPATGRARTPAQRSADLRARARTQVFEETAALGDRSSSCLLEGFAAAFRARLPFEVERIAAELLRRLGHAKAVAVTEIEPVTATGKAVAVTENAAAKGYPSAVKRLAVAMADRGEGPARIRAAITAAVGRAPDTTNYAKTLARWRAALRVGQGPGDAQGDPGQALDNLPDSSG